MINFIKGKLGIPHDRYLIDIPRDAIAFKIKKKPRVSKHAKGFYANIINDILMDKMGIPKRHPVLKKMRKNILATEDRRHVTRAIEVLTLLANYGMNGENAIKFLNGAHFIVEDNGELFEKFSEIEGAQERFSSHFADTRLEEKGIHCGRIIPEILFLSTFDPEDANKLPKESHFQVESSPWRGKGMSGIAKAIITNPQILEHIPDSVVYGYKKARTPAGDHVKNLGAYGWSEHNDTNPIVLDPPLRP